MVVKNVQVCFSAATDQFKKTGSNFEYPVNPYFLNFLFPGLDRERCMLYSFAKA